MKREHQVLDKMKLSKLTGFSVSLVHVKFMLPSKPFLSNSGNRTLFKMTFHYTQIGELTVYLCMLPKQFHNVLYIFLKVDFVNDLVQYL